jgi:hypothetical protein
MDQMFLDDLVDIFLINIAIPNTFRIHDDDGSFCAPVKAAGLIHTHPARAVEPLFLDTVLGIPTQPFRVVMSTTVLVFALIHAKEQMVAIIGVGHGLYVTGFSPHFTDRPHAGCLDRPGVLE